MSYLQQLIVNRKKLLDKRKKLKKGSKAWNDNESQIKTISNQIHALEDPRN